MKIYILSSNPEMTSTESLRLALQKEHVQVKVLDPEKLFVSLNPSQVYSSKGKIPACDLLIPRLGWKTYDHGLSLVRAFEAMGCASLNSSKSIALAHDKFASLAQLARHHLPVPTTWVFHPNQIDYRKLKFKFPVVLKLFSGSQGMGVSIAKDQVSFESWVDLLRSAKTPFHVQEFIKGQEVRVVICKNQIIGSMKRIPKKGEFRSNLFLGGKAFPTRLNSEEEALALSAVKILGLDFAGVDFIRQGSKIFILEVNAFPGIKGISAALKKNLSPTISQLIQS